MNVLFLPEVRQYLDELSHILYEKEYFSYVDTAERYVEELFNDIKTTLPNHQKRLSPSYFEKFGKKMYYAVFKKSKTTQWYVFFSIYKYQGDFFYIVRYISNNHVISQHI